MWINVCVQVAAELLSHFRVKALIAAVTYIHKA